ncbi:hypothetical protein DY000_02031490 [Brassica cretica]|uniref:Uncharacterized protein n=1 Tax=Brassica cretica TaxID=69181 RepID=A0ABQ7DG81_BRACR|nr:hypothetical protein DY000_02031490 [Brassica cretica]
MLVSTWPDISHLLISTLEQVNVLRQMGQQVKWPQKMKAPDSFRNLGLWCDFHRHHGHKTEDCVALRIEVNELLQKGHLWEFLSEKAKNHLNKEVSVKSAGAVPASPPRQDRVIHVISGGSEISGVNHLKGKNQGLIAITEETSGPTKSGTRGQEDRRMAFGLEDADPESREGPPKDRYRPLCMVSLKVLQSDTCSEETDLARSLTSTPHGSHQLSTYGLANEEAGHKHPEETSSKIIPEGSGAEGTLPKKNGET